MRTRWLIVALALSVQLEAQTHSKTNGATPVRASAFMPDRLARIDSLLQSLVAAEQIPGAVVLLVRDGRVEYNKAFGYRDLGTKASMRTDDIFRIASQSKAITSLAVMMLWEEGRFQLDDPIGRYIPEFREHTVLTKFNERDSSYTAEPTTRRVTIRQLLTHSSGLDYPLIGSPEYQAIYAKAGIPAGALTDAGTLGSRMKALGALPLRHQPGERFTYGLSTDLLGYFVEVISGMPLDQFFRRRIFDPLRMNDTWFYLPEAKRGRLVTLHAGTDGKVRVWREPEGGLDPDISAKKGQYFSGGSGLTSTAADYARFLQLFLNGGELDGVRLLSRKTVEMVLTNQLPGMSIAHGLAFGLETVDNDHRTPMSVGSFEWSGALQTWYWVDPKERLIAQIYTNVWESPVRGLGARFKTLVYSALR
jgi:CubicO group peptidase (beta-lactamase class C family)